MKMNLWKSIYTGQVYEVPTDQRFDGDGWEFVGTVVK